MRVGLLADIHGNAPALEAVLRDPAMSEVDQLIILGDLVGYYFWPAEVLEALEPLAVGEAQVLGDHAAHRRAADVGALDAQRIQHADGDGYHIRSGIIVVPKGGVVKPGTVV